ncbi:MAG: urease accessory protein UreD, partial [Burkholderiaceae bacterium]
MAWHARLNLSYRVEQQRCVARHAHEGPLRILQSLYPEGDGICHNVLVHPPGGLVGGDTLDVQVDVGEGAHGLVTTPGAARFYRSDGAPALQNTRLALARGARLEWLPLEALCYSGCLAENRLTLDLADGAEMIGWDLAALGLPNAGQPFERGHLQQHLQWPGRWLERGRIAADDLRLMDGPTRLARRRTSRNTVGGIAGCGRPCGRPSARCHNGIGQRQAITAPLSGTIGCGHCVPPARQHLTRAAREAPHGHKQRGDVWQP